MPYLRPVNSGVNNALGELPNGAFNFGLFFNKWFYVDTRNWKCHTVSPNVRGRHEPMLDNLDISIKLFNGETLTVNDNRGFWDSSAVKIELEKKHKQLDSISASYEKMGYVSFRKEISLNSALIIGLGNEHPTEKGFRFDWTTGSPFIPSSSIKGVIRLAYLVNELRMKKDEEDAERFCNEISDGKLSKDAKLVFGSGELKRDKQEASRGKIIFLDAFPVSLPRLKPEIMTCHYKDYLMDGKRGPTEDQQPNPQQFWAVSPYLDQNGEKPLKFIFRMLVPKSIATDAGRFSALENALNSALTEHGIGAKTAIGHGRFVEKSNSDETFQQIICWKKAMIHFTPNNSEIIVQSSDKKKSTSKNKELIPEIYHKKLFTDRKTITADVEVEVQGNHYKLFKVV